MKSIHISTPFGFIGIMLTTYPDGTSHGTITSTLQHPDSDPGDHPEIDAIESLVLAHACAGVDVESTAYVNGLADALESIDNHS